MKPSSPMKALSIRHRKRRYIVVQEKGAAAVVDQMLGVKVGHYFEGRSFAGEIAELYGCSPVSGPNAWAQVTAARAAR